MKLALFFLVSSSLVLANQENPSTPTPAPKEVTPTLAKSTVKAPDFHTEVRAVLESTCISCHGTNEQKGGLRLDTLAFAKEGGDSGPALVAGNKSESILLKEFIYQLKMRKLCPEEWTTHRSAKRHSRSLGRNRCQVAEWHSIKRNYGTRTSFAQQGQKQTICITCSLSFGHKS